MRDVLPTLEGWIREGRRASLGTVVRTQRSAPRLPGSVMAVSESGEVAGSVTGGCVEPAVYIQSEEVLQGGPPRLASFGYADEDAMEVGLPCGGSVDVFIEPLDPELVARVAGRWCCGCPSPRCSPPGSSGPRAAPGRRTSGRG